MTTTIKVPNREIAIRAFDYLRHERQTVPALRLAHHLLHHERRSLGIGDTDWDMKRTDKLRAAERSLFSFINDMYGKRNPAVHR